MRFLAVYSLSSLRRIRSKRRWNAAGRGSVYSVMCPFFQGTHDMVGELFLESGLLYLAETSLSCILGSGIIFQ